MSDYQRYKIASEPAPHVAAHPSRFKVNVRRHKLAELLIKEMIEYRGDLPVVLSRPCVYGVFSGPAGGFLPREDKCVGCLRCTVQYPDIVQIEPNQARKELGDSYLNPDQVDTILYEASTGRVPVKGAGYRGAYGGSGWDGMWTDMSEIVRPTRDGIHGREHISTEVDLGPRPMLLQFDTNGQPIGERPQAFTLPVPFVFDVPPSGLSNPKLLQAWLGAAEAVGTLAVLPAGNLLEHGLVSEAALPLFGEDWRSEWAELRERGLAPRMVEFAGAAVDELLALQQEVEAAVAARVPFGTELVGLAQAGVTSFHLTANYHGQTHDDFVLEAIGRAHRSLVEAGLRERVTLIGSGGIVAAEHVPKAIICGLDLVGLDTALLIALQGAFAGEATERGAARIELPQFDSEWGAQRLINLSASWRDQLLEILGAMGMREVRRLRGETGRAMFQQDLEREAFAGIEGYPHE